MSERAFSRGLHAVGESSWAYLQPDGSWGYSNAGLIACGGASVLVDTLFDLRLTRDMLDAMSGITRANPIRTLVNTHANGDHCWGNQLVTDAEIIASRAAAEEMRAFDPQSLRAWLASAEDGDPVRFLRRIFRDFCFDGVVLTPPTTVFDHRLDLVLGGCLVSLLEVGPAHTRGDVIVHVPSDRVVFTGDIVFAGCTPIVWEGPLSNWIRACDLLLSLDVDRIVPGHGPITDHAGVRAVRDYLRYVDAEASARFRAGMPALEAARDIALGDFADWLDPERLAVNVAAKYRELRATPDAEDATELIALMQRYG